MNGRGAGLGFAARVGVANGAGELHDFKLAATQCARKNGPCFIEQIVKSLRGEQDVDIARDLSFDLVEIVVGQRVENGQLDGGVGRGFVVREANAWVHGRSDPGGRIADRSALSKLEKRDRIVWHGRTDGRTDGDTDRQQIPKGG